MSCVLYTLLSGHPLYIEEIVRSMQCNHLLTVIQGACVLSPEFSEAGMSAFPDSIEGVIVDRIGILNEC